MLRRKFLATAAASALAPRFLKAAPLRPNVLFLLAAHWRGQAMPGSDPNLNAPNLERFAQQSTQFDRAYTSYPLQNPSRAALITGRFPHACGVTNDDVPLPAGQRTLPQVLKAAGYDTGFTGPWMPRAGLGSQSDSQVDVALAFLKQKRQNPFVLLIAWPSLPPISGRLHTSGRIELRRNVPEDYAEQARNALALYYAHCSELDSEIGRLLRALDELHLAGDTIVIFTSDRGDMLGSQGLERDNVPFEESVRVPLLIRYPRRIEPDRGFDFPVSNVDLMPTVLGLCGAEIPAEVQGKEISALTTAGGGPRPESVYSEGKIGSADEWRMLVRGADKLITDRDLNATHLFNLATDPYELQNLAQDSVQELKRDELTALLKDWMRRTGDGMDPSGLKKRSA